MWNFRKSFIDVNKAIRKVFFLSLLKLEFHLFTADSCLSKAFSLVKGCGSFLWPCEPSHSITEPNRSGPLICYVFSLLPKLFHFSFFHAAVVISFPIVKNTFFFVYVLNYMLLLLRSNCCVSMMALRLFLIKLSGPPRCIINECKLSLLFRSEQTLSTFHGKIKCITMWLKLLLMSTGDRFFKIKFNIWIGKVYCIWGD